MSADAVIFDLDDTLYRERRFALGGYAAVALRVQADTGTPARAVFRCLVGALRQGRRRLAFQDACDAFDIDPAAVPRWIDVYRSHSPRLRMAPPVAALLGQLRRSYRLGVLTNGLPAVQRAKVRALRLESMVDAVVFAEEHGAGKPDAAAFVEVLRRLGARAERSVFVGDDFPRDVAGALGVGMSAVWVCRGPAADGPGAGPHAVIGSLSELPSALRGMETEEVRRAH
jgi:putative hydrolase of the HAD superfamily